MLAKSSDYDCQAKLYVTSPEAKHCIKSMGMIKEETIEGNISSRLKLGVNHQGK
jgi:hypothetical protein